MSSMQRMRQATYAEYWPQQFCDDFCRGAYHRRKYRQQAVEEAEERREARIDGRGTPEQRKKTKRSPNSACRGAAERTTDDQKNISITKKNLRLDTT